MENYYELTLKNGFVFFVSTNEEGVCEFSVNGDEYLIQAQKNEKGEVVSFSFSVGRSLQAGKEDWHEEAKGFSVISVRRASYKRLRELQSAKTNEGSGLQELKNGWQPSMLRGKTYFRARQGHVEGLCA